MTKPQKESLHQIFRDLHAHRVATMDPAKLQVNVDQRKTLVDTADWSKFIKAGDQVEPFRLPEVDGGDASRAQSKASGSFIGDTTGTGTWELPQPTVVVIGKDRVVRFADVHPDWLLRTEAQPVLDAVAKIVSEGERRSAESASV